MVPSAILQMLQNQVGDQDTNVLANILPVFWNARADKDQIIDGLRYQYTLRDAIDVLKGNTWQFVQTQEGDVQKHYEQKLSNLEKVYADCQDEILRLEAHAQGNRGPVVAPLLHKAPRRPGPFRQTPECPYPNPNDPGYRGDPIVITTVPDTPMY